MTRTIGALACALVWPTAALAQSLTREVDVSAGQSSEHVTAGGVQARLFGTVKGGWRVYLEATWATEISDIDSDAFGSAFPYDRRLRPMETYAERTMSRGRLLAGVRAGRYRTPFGISSRSDHGYTGFTRAPLIRYGGNWALSNTALEAGGSAMVGVPALTVEASVGAPQDSGDAPRERTLDTVVRLQGYYRSFIVGLSYLNTRAYREGPWVHGREEFRGVDGRWMRGGVMVRGEWIAGRPFAGVATRGGYVDVVVHRVSMGPVTAVARADRLDYDAGVHSAYLRRYTVGARVRLSRHVSLQVNALGQPGGLPGGRTHAFDVGVTQTLRF